MILMHQGKTLFWLEQVAPGATTEQSCCEAFLVGAVVSCRILGALLLALHLREIFPTIATSGGMICISSTGANPVMLFHIMEIVLGYLWDSIGLRWVKGRVLWRCRCSRSRRRCSRSSRCDRCGLGHRWSLTTQIVSRVDHAINAIFLYPAGSHASVCATCWCSFTTICICRSCNMNASSSCLQHPTTLYASVARTYHCLCLRL